MGLPTHYRRLVSVGTVWHPSLQIAMGKVEAGTVRVGSAVRVMPGNVRGRVDKIYVNEIEVLQALPGENIKLKLKGVGEADLHKGCVCLSSHPLLSPIVWSCWPAFWRRGVLSYS